VSTPELHPSLDHVAGLLGRWQGEGAGQYPTIDSFAFREELVFAHVGKPFLTYAQRTWSPEGTPMHVETGYLRFPGDDRVEFLVAQPTGAAEVHEGSVRVVADAADTDAPAVHAVEIDLESSAVALTTTAKPISAVHRRFRLAEDQLSVTVGMAAVGRELSVHLVSHLTRA
jgi:hypothetical protein